jgi:hypothetical protein
LPRVNYALAEPLPGGCAAPRRLSRALIRPRHPRPVPHRPSASALDAPEPRRLRRPHRQVLAQRAHPCCRHRAAQKHGVPPSSATWPRRASSRVSGALVASMPTSSSAASCRQRAGCPTRDQGVSHRREQKKGQGRIEGTRKRDSQNQGLASERSLTTARNGRRGCGPGGSPGSGCRSGDRSPVRRAASRHQRCCSAPAKRTEPPKGAFKQEGGSCQCQNIGGKGPSERCPASQRPAARSLPRV